MRCNGLVLAAVALLAGAVYSQDNGAKSEKEMLQGEWKPVSVTTEGTDVTPILAKVTDGSDLISFDGDKMVTKQGAEKKSLQFKLNPAGNPKELDLYTGDGKTVVQAIYRVDGDDLTICLSFSEK